MRRCADQSVVKREPDAVFFWQMRVDDIGMETVGVAEQVKKTVRLGFGVRGRTDGEKQSRVRELRYLFVIAEDHAIFLCLLCPQKRENFLFLT